MQWWEALGIGGSFGSAITLVTSKVLSRRKDSADSSKAEAEAAAAWQAATLAANEMVSRANDEVEKSRKGETSWYEAAKAIRNETDAKINEVRAEHAAELSSLRTRNEALTEAVEAMAHQLNQRTVDRAEVEWARLRNIEYEGMKVELAKLRVEVEQIPYLRTEVARLTILLEEEQRAARANEEIMRRQLNQGDTPNG